MRFESEDQTLRTVPLFLRGTAGSTARDLASGCSGENRPEIGQRLLTAQSCLVDRKYAGQHSILASTGSNRLAATVLKSSDVFGIEFLRSTGGSGKVRTVRRPEATLCGVQRLRDRCRLHEQVIEGARAFQPPVRARHAK